MLATLANNLELSPQLQRALRLHRLLLLREALRAQVPRAGELPRTHRPPTEVEVRDAVLLCRESSRHFHHFHREF